MFKNIEFYENEDMKKHTTFKIGGKARFFVLPKNVKELKACLNVCKKNNLKFFILGNGSNVLVDDNGYNGAIICLKKLNSISIKTYKSHSYVTACAGVSLFALNKFLASKALSGLEWSYGIPGSVGGATKMNAGAFGNSIGDFICELTYLKDNKIMKTSKIDFEYRKGFEKGIIISIKLKLKNGNMHEIQEKMNSFFATKKSLQPYDLPSAGSTFKRHKDFVPSKLIDEFNLKGLRFGDAMISPKHAGFIVNLGSAKCSDVLKLIDLVKLIFSLKQMQLEEEIIYLN